MANNPISHIFFYNGGILLPQTNNLRSQLAFLNQPNQPHQGVNYLPATRLVIVLSSWGGNTHEMRSLYDLIGSLSYQVDFHLVGTVKSAAVPLFLAGARRTAAPGTTFLFHPWTWGTELHPGHTAESLIQFPAQLEDDIEWGKKVFIERTKFPAADVGSLFGKARIENTEFALKHGFIDEVVNLKLPTGVMTWNIM